MSTRRARNKSAGKRALPIVWIGLAIVAVLLLAAMLFGGSDPAPTEYGSPALNGQPLAELVSPVADPAIGRVAPEVAGQDFDETPVVIEHDGIPKALIFLAHWCPHCQAEVPLVQSWLDETGGVPGTEIVSVATGIDPKLDNYPASDWLDSEGWTSPVIRDDEDSSVFTAYGGGSFPFWVVLDGNGAVVARSAGGVDLDALAMLLTQLAG